ncbi:hypothetical protein LTR66_014367, partial [Elasticomyces elasticus]
MVTVVPHVNNGTTSLRVLDERTYIMRQRELERRLKEEREGRIVDRDGMRQRLFQRDHEMAELKRQLQREKAINAATGTIQSQQDSRYPAGEASALTLPRTRSRGGDSIRSGHSNRGGSPSKKLTKEPRAQGGFLIGDEPIDPAQSFGSNTGSYHSGQSAKENANTHDGANDVVLHPQYNNSRERRQYTGFDGANHMPQTQQSQAHDPLALSDDATEEERLMAQGGGLGYRNRIASSEAKKYPPSAPVRSDSYGNGAVANSRTASRSSNETQNSAQKKRHSGISESVRNKLINRLSNSHNRKAQLMQEGEENGIRSGGGGGNGSRED